MAAEIAGYRSAWLEQWMPKLTSDETPINPYRLMWDINQTVDKSNTIITHDAGNPRDQLAPFYQSEMPQGYIGWGHSTQLGYSTGLGIGLKLARPDTTVINVLGDAGFGMSGFDLETAVRSKVGTVDGPAQQRADGQLRPVHPDRDRALQLGFPVGRLQDDRGGPRRPRRARHRAGPRSGPR